MSSILYVVVRVSLSFPNPLNRNTKYTSTKKKVTKSIDPLLPIHGSPTLYERDKLDELYVYTSFNEKISFTKD